MKKFLSAHKATLVGISVILAVSLIPVAYLFRDGYFLSDDGEWMVIRFSAFYQALRDGQIPPRFFDRLNHGYGYPIGVFLYPAFMYMAVPFKLIGLSFQESIKAVIIFSFVFSGIGSFLWLKHRFSVLPALLGATLYVYFPYHIYDLYVRGSVGELVAFAVLPFLLFSIDKKQIILGGLFYGVLILSHNTFAFLLTPFLLLYTLLLQERRLFILYPLGLMLSAFFWVPSLMELSFTRFAQTAIAEWREYFLTNETIPLVGGVGLLGLLGGIKSITERKDREAMLFFGIFLLSVFFASSVSGIFWQPGLLPKLVQFPWRFLILTLWSVSFLTAFWLSKLSGMKLYVGSIIVGIIIVLSALPYFSEYRSVVRDDGFYATNEDTTTTKQEYMPRWVDKVPDSRPDKAVEITKGEGTITQVEKKASGVRFVLDAETATEITIKTIDYPGWEVFVNGKKIQHRRNSEGVITLALPEGNYAVSTRFTETPLRLLADLVSAGTAGVLLLVFLFPGRLQKGIRWYNKKLWKRT